GRYPFDPTIILHVRDPLGPLGVPADAPVATDVAAAKAVLLVPPGDTNRGKPAQWAYTTQSPPAGWEAPGFNDSAWTRGAAGFGTHGTPGIRIATEWNSPRIWLRTTFEAPPLGQGDIVRLHLFHDEDVEVRLNGSPIFRARGYVTDYVDVALDDAAKS